MPRTQWKWVKVGCISKVRVQKGASSDTDAGVGVGISQVQSGLGCWEPLVQVGPEGRQGKAPGHLFTKR